MKEELIKLLDSRIDRANSHWQFCYSLCLIVVGWAGTLETDAVMLEIKVSMCVGVIVALFFNLLAILRTQKEMIAISSDIKSLLTNTDQSFHDKFLSERNYSWYPKATIVIYILLASMTCIVVFGR